MDLIVYSYNTLLYSVEQKAEMLLVILNNKDILSRFYDLYYRHN